jgi:hypothetical protein
MGLFSFCANMRTIEPYQCNWKSTVALDERHQLTSHSHPTYLESHMRDDTDEYAHLARILQCITTRGTK